MISRRKLLATALATPLASVFPTRGAFANRLQKQNLPQIGLTRGFEKAKQLRAAGGEFLEIGSNVLMPAESDEAFKERGKQLLECGLPIYGSNGFMPGSLRSTGPKADHAGIAKRASVIFARAETVGMRVVTFGSSASRSIPEDYAKADAELQFVALLARLAPLAARHGITLCVEPLQKSETNFIQYVSEAKRLVSAVQQPNIGITADIYHMMRGDEPAQAIRDAAPFIKHVHIAEKEKRTAPGVAGDDFTPYLQALKDINYPGRISIESRWDSAEAQLPKAIETIAKQWEALK